MQTAISTSIFSLVVVTLAVSSCGTTARKNDDGVVKYSVINTIALDTVDQVRDAYIEEGGHIWLMSASAPYFTVVDTAGRVVRSGGRRGRGPTDLLYPFLWVGQNSVNPQNMEVLDIGRHQVVEVDTSLRVIRSVDLRLIEGSMRADMPQLVASLPFAIVAIPDGYIAVGIGRNVSNSKDLAHQILVRVRRGRMDTLWVNQEVGASPSRWLRPYPLWAACSGKGLVGVNTSGRLLLRVSRDGDVDTTRLPFVVQREAVNADHFRVQARLSLINEYRESGLSFNEDTINAATERVVARTRISPLDSLPAFSAIRCAGDGSIWLQEFNLKESSTGAGAIWWRLKDGISTRALLPFRFWPISVARDQVVGILSDSSDVATLAFVSPRQ